MDENGTTGTPQLGDILNGLMSNPEMMAKIGEVLKSMPQNAPDSAGEPPPEPAETPDLKDGDDASSAAPAAFLSPEMMKMLPNVLSMLGPMLAPQKPDNNSDTAKETAAGPKPSIAAGASPQHKAAENRAKLLHALKPYLSPHRGEAIEQILSITQITDLLSDSGMLSPKGKENTGAESEEHTGK